MKIIIYRGTHQIGGCITEIQSNNGTRIAIDIGENLPTINKEKTYTILIYLNINIMFNFVLSQKTKL